MTSKIPKRQSKRTPVRLRHKIEKRSAEKQRKERKHAKKHPELHRKKKNAEKLNIPNSFPYKDRLLAEIEEGRRLKAEEAARRKEEGRMRRRQLGGEVEEEGEEVMRDVEEEEAELREEGDEMETDDEEEENGGGALAALLASAQARATEFDEEHDDSDSSSIDDDNGTGFAESSATSRDTSRKQYDKLFKRVLDASDVILYVLDARDPNGTRSRAVERQIMSATPPNSKRLILILNKIDLVPPPVLQGWLTYLRRYFPTLPLKASNAAPNAQSFDHKSLSAKGTATALLGALKAFAHASQLKRAVTVGVIGYPNVGKSSAINALLGPRHQGSAACPTGAEAGVTTGLREVKLDKKLKLLDSPGIVFPNAETTEKAAAAAGGEKEKEKEDEHARLILLNVVPPKQMRDPIPAVTLLLRRFSTSPALLDKLLAVYGVPPIANTSPDALTRNFLIEVARKRGRLGKGGVPNLESAAVAVIMDWRAGRIQGWVEAPVAVAGAETRGAQGIRTGAAAAVEPDQKEIVGEWMREFRLDALEGYEQGAEEMLEAETAETAEVEMEG